jgi:hypothetical protein
MIPNGWLSAAGTRRGPAPVRTPGELPSLLMMGLGLGLVFAPVFNTGTGGAIIAVILFRSGPLTRPGQPQQVKTGPATASESSRVPGRAAQPVRDIDL